MASQESSSHGEGEDELIWNVQQDPKSGSEYYYNSASGKTVWEAPDDRWHRAVQGDTKREFYFNLALHATSWARPVDYDSDDDREVEEDKVMPLGTGNSGKQGSAPRTTGRMARASSAGVGAGDGNSISSMSVSTNSNSNSNSNGNNLGGSGRENGSGSANENSNNGSASTLPSPDGGSSSLASGSNNMLSNMGSSNTNLNATTPYQNPNQNHNPNQNQHSSTTIVEYEYHAEDGISNGKWIPYLHAETGNQYWANSDFPKPFWSKPKNAKHTHKEVSVKTENLLTEAARALRYAVGNMHDTNDEMKQAHDDLLQRAEAQYQQVHALSRANKLKNVHSQLTHARTGRYLENQLESTAVSQPTKLRTDHSVASFLKSIPLFHNLDETQFAMVQRGLERVAYNDQDVIIKQDTVGEKFHLIEHGQVKIHVYSHHSTAATAGRRKTRGAGEGDITANSKSKDESLWGPVVNILKAGDYFGEKSLYSNTAHNATVVANGPVTCFTLPKDIFLTVAPKDGNAQMDQNATHTDEEIGSLAGHIGNYEVLLERLKLSRNDRDKKIWEALLALNTAFSPELNVNDTIERMIKILYNVFETDRISLFFVDWDTNELLLQVSKDSDIREVRLPINAGIVGACVAENQVINVQDARKDPRFFGDMDKKSGFVTRSVLCAPIHDGHGRVDAVIQLVNKRGNGFFSQDEESILRSVADQMELTLAHKKVEMQTNVGDKYTPIWRASEKFKLKLKKFYGASLPTTVASDEVVVTLSMYHAGVKLCPDTRIRKKAERVSPLLVVNFQEELELDIKLMNVPRAARLIFNFSYAQYDEKKEKHTDEPGEPIGWAGSTLFNFDQVLRSGHTVLKLFEGTCDDQLAGVATLLSNSTKKDVDLIELDFPAFEKPVIYTDHEEDVNTAAQEKEKNTSKKMEEMMRASLDAFIGKDPLYKMTEDEKLVLRASREKLKDNPSALPKFLQAIQWNSRPSIQLAYRMMYRWALPTPQDALTLLDSRNPDPKVRAYAVSVLENLPDNQLQMYLLQLIQAIKAEMFTDSALSRFLLRRSLRSPKFIGQKLFWLMMGEMHVLEARRRYRALVDLFLRHCGDYRTALGHQMFVLSKLQKTSEEVKKKPKNERTEYARKLLSHIVFPEKFQLPLHPEMFFKGLNINQSRVMNSKKVPLWLSFENATPNRPPFVCLYKAGDDLRQDQLTLQVLSVIETIWKEEGMDLNMSVYGTVSTGYETGMIEVVENSSTIAKITAGKTSRMKKMRAVMNVYDDKKLKRWLRNRGHPIKTCENNFLRSAAAYCVATYVLGIGDRHNDNIMLKDDGTFFHIDFGHFLGNFKSKMGIKRERAPFVFTPAMAQILGGPGSAMYKEFEKTCCDAYNVLRRHSNLLITLFSLMLDCGIPELRKEDDLVWLRDKLLIGAEDEIASKHFISKINEALNTKTTQLNDVAHMLKHA